MNRWRILLHAMDRTGPPMLALAFLRWMTAHLPDHRVQVIAFRGGELRGDFDALAPTLVLLRDREPWDHGSPSPQRTAELRREMDHLEAVEVSLLVSVAAGQALPLLEDCGTIFTWVVEQGEDLHWLGAPLDMAARSDIWLAGSEGTRRELEARLARSGPAPVVEVAEEFIEEPQADPAAVVRCRAELAGASGAFGCEPTFVLGAGIGTHRKGADLFVEAALEWARRHPQGVGSTAECTRFVWIGGTDDPLVPMLRDEVRRHGADIVTFLGPRAGIDDWLAAGDVFLHTARLDAFPLVCLHAAGSGTPVVAFEDCGGTEEMFANSFVGAPYPDVRRLVSRVEQVLSDPGPVAAAQQARVRTHYTASEAAPSLFATIAGRLADHV